MVSYTAFSPLPRAGARGGLFSVALSRGSPRVGVTHHRSLWSPDVPRGTFCRTCHAAAWPTHSLCHHRLQRVRILLPPSEGKTSPPSGPALDLDSLSHPELAPARAAIIKELIEVSGADAALDILKAGERIRPEVEAQRRLWEAPCAPAREVYTGVLYEAAQLREGDDVVIFSGLFGVTSGADLIPAYRLSMNVKLPRAGALKSFWRKQLVRGFLPAPRESDPTEVTVDMRSGAYLVWNPPGPWWDVRVRDSSGKVITHMAKHYRGLLTRALLDTGSDDVLTVAAELGAVAVESDGNRHHLTLTPRGM